MNGFKFYKHIQLNSNNLKKTKKIQKTKTTNQAINIYRLNIDKVKVKNNNTVQQNIIFNSESKSKSKSKSENNDTTYIISSSIDNKGLDMRPLRNILKKFKFIENVEPTSTPVLLWMEQVKNNKFDNRYFNTQCYIMNLLSKEKEVITNKYQLYRIFNSLYKTQCSQYMATSFELGDFLNKQIYLKYPDIYIIRPIRTYSGRGIIMLDTTKENKNNNELKNKLSIATKMLETNENVIVSNYIDNPLLFQNKKFHLRIYFLVSRIKNKYATYMLDISEVIRAKLPYKHIDYENKEIHDTHFQWSTDDIFCPIDFDEKMKSIYMTYALPKIKSCLYYISKILEPYCMPYENAENAFEMFGCDFLIRNSSSNYNIILMEINEHISYALHNIKNKPLFADYYFKLIDDVIFNPAFRNIKPKTPPIYEKDIDV